MKEKQEITIGGLYSARIYYAEIVVIEKDDNQVWAYMLNNGTGIILDADMLNYEFRYVGLYKKHKLWQKLKFCWKFIMSKRG